MAIDTETQKFIASIKQKAIEQAEIYFLSCKELEKFGEPALTKKEKKEIIGQNIFYEMPMSMRMTVLRMFAPEKKSVNSYVKDKQKSKQFTMAFLFLEQVAIWPPNNKSKH